MGLHNALFSRVEGDPAAGVLTLVAIFIAVSIGFFVLYVRAFLRNNWSWLQTWGDRLRFLLWPLPPRNMLKLVDLDNTVRIFYNVRLVSGKKGGFFETPMGVVNVDQVISRNVGLNYYIEGLNTPLQYASGAIAGLALAFVSTAIAADRVFSTGAGFAVLFLMAVWLAMWWEAATRPNITYYSYYLTSMTSGGLHAVPAPGEMVSPIAFLSMLNRGVTLVVDKSVVDVFNQLSSLLGGRHTAAIISAKLSQCNSMEKISIARAVEGVRTSLFQYGWGKLLLPEITRANLAKVLVWGFWFLVGLAVGWGLFGGGSVAIVPGGPPEGLGLGG